MGGTITVTEWWIMENNVNRQPRYEDMMRITDLPHNPAGSKMERDDWPVLFVYAAGENGGGDCDYFHKPVEPMQFYIAAEFPDGTSYTVSRGFASWFEADLYMRGAEDLLMYRAEQSRQK